MALNAEGYFDHIKACLNPDFVQDRGGKAAITLTESVPGGKPIKVTFPFQGEAFAVNLDLKPKKKGDDPRLFRFLDDEAKPWARKCDFVVFHRLPVGIYAYLIEFKSSGIDGAGIKAQLDASVCWLKSLKRVVEYYYHHDHLVNVQKFVFSSNTNPGAYLDGAGKYLKADPTIRLYQYDQLSGISLGELENKMIEPI